MTASYFSRGWWSYTLAWWRWFFAMPNSAKAHLQAKTAAQTAQVSENHRIMFRRWLDSEPRRGEFS